ncbi:FxsA family protein [Gilvimarinus sp. SDUM040013]|uniref:FxsA family protein n=1 Tax=Gilvimarinus gilvus TaxID=3058038 RepID=A0ABU4RT09_9GAMM|nr:FxsA family protein [Gilvimarinus sp. SDUM040013]MDO3387085.1 FxsA family protein [Gilvimarinus sp. SDUM040013]MDX6848020.1 FxsA family protein [Gilvimarinus sp. SDUM040013]
MPIILLLFIGIPLLEIALFIQVGDELGVLNTVALVILTAVIGVGLLRWQGFETLSRARAKMDSGEMPAREMAEGLMLLVAGALLLTPGFFTDAVGFALLVPWLRYALFMWAGPRIMVRGGASFGAGAHFRGGRPHGDTSNTFEGEFTSTPESSDEPDKLDKK